MVTSEALTGDGSLLAAVEAANQNPGHDTIQFSEGLQIDLTSKDPAFKFGVVRLTDSVTIDGAGSTVFSTPAWISTAGDINNDSTIDNTGTIIVLPAMRFLRIGNFGEDNSGIEVTVRNLHASQLNSFATAEDNASLIVENVTISDFRSIAPQQVPFIEGNFTNLTIRNTSISGSTTFADVVFVGDSFYAFAGGIAGSGNLIMENVTMRDNDSAGAVLWTGGEAKIVSSQFIESGGIQTFATNMAIVNSAFDFGINTDDGENSIVAGGGAVIEIIASSLSTRFHGSQPNNNGQPLMAAGGQIDLIGSAIYGGLAGYNLEILDGLAYYATLGGSFTADDASWVSPVDEQDAEALKLLFQNSNLRTEAPGLSADLGVIFPQSVTPLLGSPEAPGQLIDVISSALVNPIDNMPIEVDVLGNPRVDGNGFRNIGAVQLSLAPHLAVSGTGDSAVNLSWSRPKGDLQSGFITGFQVFYRPDGTSEWTEGDSYGANATQAQITGLTNGLTYEFEVAAIYETGEGPRSNEVTATPYADIQAPEPMVVPGVFSAKLNWEVPDTGGYSIRGYGIYYRLAGADVWTFFGTTTDTNVIVSGLQSDTEYEFGVKTITTDGQFSSKLGTTTATTLRDIQFAFSDLRERTLELCEQGYLNSGQCRSLLVKLDHAEAKLSRGQTGVAINQLNALRNETQAFIRGMILAEEQGLTLLDPLELLINDLNSLAS
jgi:hypothetical protein